VNIHTYCRLCESRCGLIAHVDDGQITELLADPSDPVSGGYICDTAKTSLTAMRSDRRITTPMKRENGTLVPVSWDTATREIGQALRKIRKSQGADSVGLYLGEDVQRSSRTLARSLAFGVGFGTRHIFSELCLGAGPRQWITERMIGYPTPLISDLGRAHHIVLLGGDARSTGWGSMHPGMCMEEQIQHSRRTKKTKVVVADARRSALAQTMDQHIPIRPGTEPFFLLGMLVATVRGQGQDNQFVRDYTVGFDQLREMLDGVTVEWCADICGIEAAALAGVALKFRGAAMAVAHLGHGALMNANAALGAWAWLALHTVTANTLRPGGLYESAGAIDLFPAFASVPMSGAPKLSGDDHGLMLMQAPATRLVASLRRQDKSRVQALICVSGDPVRTLNQPAHTSDALQGLDLLVCIASHEDKTAQYADWVLPPTHAWEQPDLTVHDNTTLPFRGLLWTPALTAPPAQARTPETILKDIFRAVKPGLRGSPWGLHLDLLSRSIVSANLEKLEHRLLDWSHDVKLEKLPEDCHRLNLGTTDRATWRPTTPDERIHIVPDGLAHLVREAHPPTTTKEKRFLLRTSRALDRAPDPLHRPQSDATSGIRVHPEAGIPDGKEVRVRTDFGELATIAWHDPELRPDTIAFAPEHHPEGLSLCDGAGYDPLCGAPIRDGLACSVEPVR
jgi:anaerobic selenocysteine-containing dehydrogenase